MKFRLVEEKELDESLFNFDRLKSLIRRIKRAKHAEDVKYEECLQLLQMFDRYMELSDEDLDNFENAAAENPYFDFALDVFLDKIDDEDIAFQYDGYEPAEIAETEKNKKVREKIWKLVKKYFKKEI